jgi:hypothetical protein
VPFARSGGRLASQAMTGLRVSCVRRTSSTLGSITLLSAALLLAPVMTGEAHAQTSAQDRAAADALFDSAVRLMDQGKYEEACPKLEKSYELDPGVGTLLNLARCYEKAGRLASAWTTYREASSKARIEVQAAREEHARTEAKNLEPRLIRIQIDVPREISQLPGFALSQNGKKLIPDAVIGEPIPVDKGVHQITVSADGYKERVFDVRAEKESQTYNITVDRLEPDGSAAPPPPPEETVQPEPVQQPQPQKAAEKRSAGPIILGATGLVAAGVGTAFAFVAKGHDNRARDICDNPRRPCTEEDVEDWEDSLSQARTSATIAYIGWGVGGAALAGAVIWYIVDTPSSGNETVRKVRFAPVLGSNSWGISAQGKF